jgi:puromycin-sensitive aminopeptidase
MKASFGITLVVPEELLAVSNGAEVSRTSLEDGTDRVVFADTIALSTYLVAFVVGPLEATDPIHVDGVPVRIIHPPGRADQTAFALEVAAHSLRWLADWYDIAVPGGKVDLVALPDFAFGAMENLGCITFREVLLLVDPTSADQHELESVAAVISHELAHLWFGDLVTMRWWNGIWLNEAFATFMEMKAVEAWRPDWDVWAGFGAARAAALDIDALASTRPIEYPVVTPADAESMFDLLTYQKGAAVVRMLEQFLGEEVFRDGVHRYLSAHLGGNTDNEDLWTALEEASGQPVGDLMHAWIFRGGFPVVEGTVEGGRCTLVQRRFRYDGVDDDARWEVPVRLRTTVGEQRILLGDSPLVLDLEGPLVTLNVGAEGFYRSEVDVPPDPGRLTPVERAMSVDDRWAATLGGRHNPASFAGFVAAFADDPDLAVWQAVLRGLYTMNLVAPGRHLTMAAEAAGLLGGMVHRLGWEPSDGEDDRTRQLRGVLLVAAGTLADDPGVIGEARRRWSAGTSTDPAVDGAVVTIVASHGDSADRADCRRRFDAAGTSQEEQRHLRALALFPGLTEVEALLDEVHGGAIRTQDAPFLIRSLLAHPHHRALIWRNLVDHWEDLTGRLPSNGIARMLEGIRALGADADPDVDRFLDEHPTPQGALMVAQHRERRHVNLGLGNRLAG